jgi:hypothetical protein
MSARFPNTVCNHRKCTAPATFRCPKCKFGYCYNHFDMGRDGVAEGLPGNLGIAVSRPPRCLTCTSYSTAPDQRTLPPPREIPFPLIVLVSVAAVLLLCVMANASAGPLMLLVAIVAIGIVFFIIRAATA